VTPKAWRIEYTDALKWTIIRRSIMRELLHGMVRAFDDLLISLVVIRLYCLREQEVMFIDARMRVFHALSIPPRGPS